ncbi:MAG: hypothetical protein AB7V43_16210 [Acidimicrobiia bacterium]
MAELGETTQDQEIAAVAVEEDHLLLDQLSERLDSLKLIRAEGGAAKDAALEQFGAKGKVEEEILLQLGAWKPLFKPDRFEEAHRTAMRALEVFDRNGARAPSSLPKLGPLTPVAEYVVKLFIRFIVRNHQANVIDSIRHLYGRREANSPKGSAEFNMLRLARLQAERLAPGFKKKSVGLPAFVLGGAVISSLTSGMSSLVKAATDSLAMLIVAVVLFAVVALAGFWSILTAAAIARRRCRIALDQPLKALWETIGAAGNPPKDESRDFAIYALILLVLAWAAIPIAIGISLAT